MIRKTWNPAIGYIIAACWSDLAASRPDLRHIMAALSMVMKGGQGFITLSAAKQEFVQSDKDLRLAAGAPWRRVRTTPNKIMLGGVIGEGAYSTVTRGTFQEREVAVKIFRNTTEEKAFKEIEVTFALRHPNIIGLYAWFQQKGGFSKGALGGEEWEQTHTISLNSRSASRYAHADRSGLRDSGGWRPQKLLQS